MKRKILDESDAPDEDIEIEHASTRVDLNTLSFVVLAFRLDHEKGRSKSYYGKHAIQNFLEEREEHLLALSVLERNEPWERAI